MRITRLDGDPTLGAFTLTTLLGFGLVHDFLPPTLGACDGDLGVVVLHSLRAELGRGSLAVRATGLLTLTTFTLAFTVLFGRRTANLFHQDNEIERELGGQHGLGSGFLDGFLGAHVHHRLFHHGLALAREDQVTHVGMGFAVRCDDFTLELGFVAETQIPNQTHES